MFVLAMATLLRHLAPAIRFDPFDNVTDLHTLPLLGAAFFRLDAGRLAT
jgi:hypothetical protein